MFAALLILTIGTTAADYPFLPRHLTIASSLGVGISAFFLALGPSSGRWQSTSFLRDVARFAVPVGLAAGTAVLVPDAASAAVALAGIALASPWRWSGSARRRTTETVRGPDRMGCAAVAESVEGLVPPSSEVPLLVRPIHHTLLERRA